MEKTRQVIIAIDYENIQRVLCSFGQVVDLEKLIDQCLGKVGPITGAFVFIPAQYVSREHLEQFDLVGLDTIVCPQALIRQKTSNLVDARMTRFILKSFKFNPHVTDVVLVTDDGDFLPLVTEMRQVGKKVTLFCTEKVSHKLRSVADEVYLIPVIDIT